MEEGWRNWREKEVVRKWRRWWEGGGKAVTRWWEGGGKSLRVPRGLRRRDGNISRHKGDGC